MHGGMSVHDVNITANVVAAEHWTPSPPCRARIHNVGRLPRNIKMSGVDTQASCSRMGQEDTCHGFYLRPHVFNLEGRANSLMVTSEYCCFSASITKLNHPVCLRYLLISRFIFVWQLLNLDPHKPYLHNQLQICVLHRYGPKNAIMTYLFEACSIKRVVPTKDSPWH